jgi:hypothetical protein
MMKIHISSLIKKRVKRAVTKRVPIVARLKDINGMKLRKNSVLIMWDVWNAEIAAIFVNACIKGFPGIHGIFQAKEKV